MRVIYSMAVLGVSLVLLGGCGDAESQSSSESGAGSDVEAAEAPSRCPQKPLSIDGGPRSNSGKMPPIRMTLEGYPDADNVGVLMADQRDYFADAGLDVSVATPVVTSNVPTYVDEGVDDVGLLSQPEVVLAIKEGMPLVAIGSLVPRPTMAMIWPRKSKIDGIADLEGKTIAIYGLSSEEDFLQSILARAGLALDDVKIRRVGYLLVPALASGRADAIFGGSGNIEGAELEARGLKLVVTPVQKLGIPSYEELVVITRRDRLDRDPQWIRPFMSAVARGTAAAIEDPKAAAEAIATSRVEREFAHPGSPKQTKAKVQATLPLLSETGRMSPRRATGLTDWMCEEGAIQGPLNSPLLTNRFVEAGP